MRAFLNAGLKTEVFKMFLTRYLADYLFPFATRLKTTPGRTPLIPPVSNHITKFLHWLTSNAFNFWHPSTTASTPTPVTRTQPLTESSRSSRRWRLMLRSEESETALPQNDRFRCVSCGQPSARTSVAVSERAQQND